MPLSPKWATPGLGSDFAISTMITCNLSRILYFNCHTSNVSSIVTQLPLSTSRGAQLWRRLLVGGDGLVGGRGLLGGGGGDGGVYGSVSDSVSDS